MYHTISFTKVRLGSIAVAEFQNVSHLVLRSPQPPSVTATTAPTKRLHEIAAYHTIVYTHTWFCYTAQVRMHYRPQNLKRARALVASCKLK